MVLEKELLKELGLFGAGGGRGEMHLLVTIARDKFHQETLFFSVEFLTELGGGFKYFLFSSLFGEDSHFD